MFIPISSNKLCVLYNTIKWLMYQPKHNPSSKLFPLQMSMSMSAIHTIVWIIIIVLHKI